MHTLWIAMMLAGAGPDPLAPSDQVRAHVLVESMKKSPRGPYQGVAWFCKDGSMQLPKAGACAERGGGRQHGVLSTDAEALARWGIHVGTVLAALQPEDILRDDLYRARALVLERFLERALDGWVLASAKSYRGARQIEDEEAASVLLLQTLTARPELVDHRRSLLLRVVRALPYGPKGARIDEIRALASRIGDADPRFQDLRGKIHSLPEASDVARVRSYLKSAKGEPLEWATALVAEMQQHYDPAERDQALRSIRDRIREREVKKGIDQLIAARGAQDIIERSTELLGHMARALNTGQADRRASRNLLLLYGMVIVEERLVDVVGELSRLPFSRGLSINMLAQLSEGARHLGLLSEREHAAVQDALVGLRVGTNESYVRGVDRLGRLPEWARARYLADFGLALSRYQVAEPQAGALVDDLLRGSVMLPMAVLLDRLNTDVDQLRGGGHLVFGLERGVGLRGENPGFATGAFRVLPLGADPAGLKRTDVVLLYDLLPNLPPVAGIISVGNGGSLSHVSLLAQNLGIPHLVMTGEGARAIESWAGRDVALGVSATRRVVLGLLEALPPSTRALAGAPSGAKSPSLRIDVSRLDLKSTEIRPLQKVSEKEAGVRLGPKAAELARLKRLFPERVSDAAVIPFGAFVRHVSQAAPDQLSPLAALQRAYGEAAKLPEAEADARVLAELERFRAAIQTLPFSAGFEAEVKAALAELGDPGTFGVFVRSDTNVEDLKDFTGAGLNLTVPNRVGFDSILGAIRAVWASPFTERSYRWRQRLLQNPEHVYPSVLLHRTVASEASGVLLTTDLETDDRRAVTISASEGVAAVVDGGSAETIVVEADGRVRLLSSSRIFSRRRVPPPPREGVEIANAEGRDPLLLPEEISEIMGLVGEIRKAIPAPEGGLPWDIEFGLIAKKAHLFQIRPLKASKMAAAHPLLLDLDRRATLKVAPLDLHGELPQ